MNLFGKRSVNDCVLKMIDVPLYSAMRTGSLCFKDPILYCARDDNPEYCVNSLNFYMIPNYILRTLVYI